MTQRAPAFEGKIRAPESLAAWLAGVPRPLVFTNGVFDLLHRGHVTYLARAREHGAALLVALNSDASVRRLGKDADRPINSLADRLAWFEDETPAALIEMCRPDVLVKGGDWPAESIVGASSVLARGGEVLSIPFEHERSTSTLLARIRGVGR